MSYFTNKGFLLLMFNIQKDQDLDTLDLFPLKENK